MILLDTCVISEVGRESPSPPVADWFSSLPEDQIRLSVLSVGEIQKGIELLDPGARRARLQRWLDGLVRLFEDRILPVDEPVARRWGSVSATAQRAGRPRPPVDALIAATALRHDLVVATRNVADFEGTGVRLVNPWTQPLP